VTDGAICEYAFAAGRQSDHSSAVVGGAAQPRTPCAFGARRQARRVRDFTLLNAAAGHAAWLPILPDSVTRAARVDGGAFAKLELHHKQCHKLKKYRRCCTSSRPNAGTATSTHRGPAHRTDRTGEMCAGRGLAEALREGPPGPFPDSRHRRSQDGVALGGRLLKMKDGAACRCHAENAPRQVPC
jgi:hypothetical protein